MPGKKSKIKFLANEYIKHLEKTLQCYCFERKEIDLGSLIGSLAFLLNALEFVDEKWEEEFLKEVTILETVNALAVAKEAGEEVSGIENNKKITY